MRFFFKDVGLNADIERHREKEKQLREKIKKLESIQNRTELEHAALSIYSEILVKLLESKADVVNKLGRK